MTSLILPDYARAPLFVPGRRNRKVHWNRALSKAIESLGTFEREDWRSAKWLPKSLRGFYPKWFASKNKAGCGCCGDPTACTDVIDCVDADWASVDLPTEAEIEMPTMTDLNCSGAGSCPDYSGAYILNQTGGATSGLYRYSLVRTGFPDPLICGLSLDSIVIELSLTCAGNCTYEGRFQIRSDQGLNAYSHDAIYQPVTSPKGTSLPWTLAFVSDGLLAAATDGHVCNLSGDFLVTAFN